jgi:hypothetical protein
MSAAEVCATNVTASAEVAAPTSTEVTASTSTDVTATTAVTAAATTVAAAAATTAGQGGCGAEYQRQQHNAYSTSLPHDISPRPNLVDLICEHLTRRSRSALRMRRCDRSPHTRLQSCARFVSALGRSLYAVRPGRYCEKSQSSRAGVRARRLRKNVSS